LRSRTGATADRSNEPVRRTGISTDRTRAPRSPRPAPGGATREPHAPDRFRDGNATTANKKVVNKKVVNKKVVKKNVYKGHGNNHYGWHDGHRSRWHFGLNIGGCGWGFGFGYGSGYWGGSWGWNSCGWNSWGWGGAWGWGGSWNSCGWGWGPRRVGWRRPWRYGCWPRWTYRPRYVNTVVWTVPWYSQPTYVAPFDFYDDGTGYVWSDDGGADVWDGTYSDGWTSTADTGYAEVDLGPAEPFYTMDEAWEMLATEQLIEARSAFEEWIAYAPSDALPRVGRGLTAALLGSDAEAVTDLREATVLDPEGILSFPADSRIRRQLEDLRERFRIRAAANREDHDSLFMVAFMGLLRQEYGEAFYTAERLIEMGDESESALVLKALLELALEEQMWGDG
jgi:hypothetical protein